ncbi:hypothetical protein [Variovorax fucosicus]|uniref:hypothetical protein n=1 Tax=Variovorax fucosicus TaxID=3053517 RepID=UPI002578385F|nr:hypothetical protein [Variovorax sp. J22G47]MDM0054068.1 hypothetical protein [Variovorax sp. J22G47]
MPMCEKCATIVTGRRHAAGHEDLKETGHSKYNMGQGTVYTRAYTCSTCGTKWEYEDDKNDDGAGWSRV